MANWDDQDIAALVISLCEPLIPLDLLVGTHNRARTTFTEHPERAKTWSAGLLHDILHTLPSSDPWRSPHPGFGTWQDGTDLLSVTHKNLLVDIGLAAIADPLPDASADLLRHVQGPLDQALTGFAQNVAAGTLFDTILPALRWTIWRRRVYVGPEDPYVMIVGFQWLPRAEAITTNQPWDHSQWQETLRSGLIADDEYDPIDTAARSHAQPSRPGHTE